MCFWDSGFRVGDSGLRIRNSGFVSRDLGFATVFIRQDADAYTSIIAVVPPLSKKYGKLWIQNSKFRKWEYGSRELY